MCEGRYATYCHCLQVLLSLLFCLRDWLMALPVKRLISEKRLPQSVMTTVFQVCVSSDSTSAFVDTVAHVLWLFLYQVLHSATCLQGEPGQQLAVSFPVKVSVNPLHQSMKTRSSSTTSTASRQGSQRVKKAEKLSSSIPAINNENIEEIVVTARSVSIYTA